MQTLVLDSKVYWLYGEPSVRDAIVTRALPRDVIEARLASVIAASVGRFDSAWDAPGGDPPSRQLARGCRRAGRGGLADHPVIASPLRRSRRGVG